MDNKPAFLDFYRNQGNDTPASEQTAETDYTLVASCILPDKSEEAKNSRIKAEKVRAYIDAGKNQPLSIKQKILHLLGFSAD